MYSLFSVGNNLYCVKNNSQKYIIFIYTY